MNQKLKAKFIIFGGRILFGDVKYHNLLIPRNKKYWERESGGGEIIIDFENKVIGFEGQSFQFGMADPLSTKMLFEKDKEDIISNLEMFCETRLQTPIVLEGFDVWIYGKQIN